MELELKHLAPYLPYGLKVINTHRGFIVDILGIQLDLDIIHNLGKTPIRFITPILRPLSDLTKEIENNGEKFVPMDVIYNIWHEKGFPPYSKRILNQKISLYVQSMPYWLIQKLFEWHFDIFDLIPNNLAIDINTIKQ